MTKKTDNTQKEVLKHGEYIVKIKQLNKKNEIDIIVQIMKPLTYEELADGWLRVTPKKKDIIHHFSIYLSQLPMNLWGKVQRSFTTDKTKDYYKMLKDGNYHYSIKYSINDEMVFELYRNLMYNRRDIEKIKDIYKELETNRVKGWIMRYTLNMISRD